MIRYRLKKDFMLKKAGSVVEKFNEHSYHFKYEIYIIPKELVESNPEYFELIKEEPKEPYWDGDLIRKYVDFRKKLIRAATSDIPEEKIITAFLNSQNEKQKPDTSKERIAEKVYVGGWGNHKKTGEYGCGYDTLRLLIYPEGSTKDIYKKFPLIKKSIENILNDDDSNFWYEIQRYTDGAIKSVTEHKFTQQQMDKAREQTWKACREITDQPIGRGEYNDGDCGDLYRNKYPTFESYLQTIKK